MIYIYACRWVCIYTYKYRIFVARWLGGHRATELHVRHPAVRGLAEAAWRLGRLATGHPQRWNPQEMEVSMGKLPSGYVKIAIENGHL